MPQDRNLVRATASLANAVDARKQCQTMLDRAQRNEVKAMLRAVGYGLTQAEAARMMGLSHGRVFQLIKEATAEPAEADTAQAS